MDRAAHRREARRARGRAGRESGRAAEWMAALWLMLRGWRIIHFRHRLRQGEVDLVARRGRVLALIEVKRRRTVAEALEAVGPRQRARLLQAGTQIAAQPGNAGLNIRLDLIAFAPGRLPRHIADAWSQD